MKDIHVRFAGIIKTAGGGFSIVYVPDQRQVLLPGHEYTIVIDGLGFGLNRDLADEHRHKEG